MPVYYNEHGVFQIVKGDLISQEGKRIRRASKKETEVLKSYKSFPPMVVEDAIKENTDIGIGIRRWMKQFTE